MIPVLLFFIFFLGPLSPMAQSTKANPKPEIVLQRQLYDKAGNKLRPAGKDYHNTRDVSQCLTTVKNRMEDFIKKDKIRAYIQGMGKRFAFGDMPIHSRVILTAVEQKVNAGQAKLKAINVTIVGQVYKPPQKDGPAVEIEQDNTVVKFNVPVEKDGRCRRSVIGKDVMEASLEKSMLDLITSGATGGKVSDVSDTVQSESVEAFLHDEGETEMSQRSAQ